MPKSLQNPHLSNVKNLSHTTFKEQLKTENYVNTKLKKKAPEVSGHFCLASGKLSTLVA